MIQSSRSPLKRTRGPHPLMAAALSVIWPGLGHFGHRNRRALILLSGSLAASAVLVAYVATRSNSTLLTWTVTRSPVVDHHRGRGAGLGVPHLGRGRRLHGCARLASTRRWLAVDLSSGRHAHVRRSGRDHRGAPLLRRAVRGGSVGPPVRRVQCNYRCDCHPDSAGRSGADRPACS